jgi:hypothetical protein
MSRASFCPFSTFLPADPLLCCLYPHLHCTVRRTRFWEQFHFFSRNSLSFRVSILPSGNCEKPNSPRSGTETGEIVASNPDDDIYPHRDQLTYKLLTVMTFHDYDWQAKGCTNVWPDIISVTTNEQ